MSNCIEWWLSTLTCRFCGLWLQVPITADYWVDLEPLAVVCCCVWCLIFLFPLFLFSIVLFSFSQYWFVIFQLFVQFAHEVIDVVPLLCQHLTQIDEFVIKSQSNPSIILEMLNKMKQLSTWAEVNQERMQVCNEIKFLIVVLLCVHACNVCVHVCMCGGHVT